MLCIALSALCERIDAIGNLLAKNSMALARFSESEILQRAKPHFTALTVQFVFVNPRPVDAVTADTAHELQVQTGAIMQERLVLALEQRGSGALAGSQPVEVANLNPSAVPVGKTRVYHEPWRTQAESD